MELEKTLQERRTGAEGSRREAGGDTGACRPHSRRDGRRRFSSIGGKIVEMRAYADDCLGGRREDEKSALEYKLRIEFPLFAHLSSLSFLSREYVEWSCA